MVLPKTCDAASEERFSKSCIQKEDFNEQCSYYAISSAGIPPEEINGCFYNSFQGTENEKKDERARKIINNNILDSEYELRKQYTISRVPSLIINGRPYLGSWRAEYVFEALCAALIKKPDACYAEGKRCVQIPLRRSRLSGTVRATNPDKREPLTFET